MSGSLPFMNITNKSDININQTPKLYLDSQPGLSRASNLKKRYDRFREMQCDIPDDQSEQIIGTVVTIASLITEHILCHPFIVLRRQCQVNLEAHKLHLTPFSLITPTLNIIRTQGFFSLWKGITSTFMLSGLSLFTENVLGEITGLPRDVDFSRDSSDKIFRHLLLKSANLALLTPFYATNLIETIQSSVASDAPGIMDVFKESCHRVLHSVGTFLPLRSWFGYGPHLTVTTHQTPLVHLVGLTVAYGLTYYVSSRFIETVIMRAWVRMEQRLSPDNFSYKANPYYHTDHPNYGLYEEEGDGFVKVGMSKSLPPTPYTQDGGPATSSATLTHARITVQRGTRRPFLPLLLPTLTGHLMGKVCSDGLLFPLETLLNRSRCHGCRVIVDDLDSGLRVTALPLVPAQNRNRSSVRGSEPVGTASTFGSYPSATAAADYYRGFGAVLAQAAFQILLLKVTRQLMYGVVRYWGRTGDDREPPYLPPLDGYSRPFPGSPTISEKGFDTLYKDSTSNTGFAPYSSHSGFPPLGIVLETDVIPPTSPSYKKITGDMDDDDK